MRAMRRDNAQTQLLMMCLECSETQPEKNAVYMQQMKLILQSCLRSGDPFTQIGAGQYWVLLPGAGSETHSAIAQRLQQAMHQRFAQSSALSYRLQGCMTTNKTGSAAQPRCVPNALP